MLKKSKSNEILHIGFANRMQKIITLWVLALLGIPDFYEAQIPGKEAWHWNFGKNVSLDFSSGIPVAGYSKINVMEGCASISDPKTGQLLFYTDGDTIWDRNNNRLPNGINLINGAFGTTTQGATIIPKPGSTNLFYVITADCEGYPNQGIFYSVVDMNLNGGYGDVSIKNVQLTPPSTTEKVVTVRHCNGSDYWVITHPWNSNDFNAYLLNSSGINNVPVVSSVGTALYNICCSGFEGIGYLKASPDGRKLASCTYNYSPATFAEVFDFDNSTGQITNPIHFAYSNPGPYACSFSPSSKKLYLTRTNSSYYSLEQIDLSVGGYPRTVISTSAPFSALQLAPNGKIYVGYDGRDSIGVINYPDSAGLSCNFQTKGVSLLSWTDCREGAPNFLDGGVIQRIPSIHDIIFCNSFQNDTADAGSGYSHYVWSNGDTTRKTFIGSPGKYWVTVTNGNGCMLTDTLQAYVIQSNAFDFLHDTAICSPIDSCYFNSSLSGAFSYQWSTGESTPVTVLSSSGNYWVNYTFNGGCVIKDSFNLTLYKRPEFNWISDSTVCLTNNQPFSFNSIAGTGFSYQWSTGATTQSILIASTNDYWVNISSGPGCYSSDTIRLYVNKDDVIKDTVICVSNFPFTLNSSTGGGANNFYAWSGGHTGPTLNVNGPGTYIATVFVKDPHGNQICVIKDTSVVTGTPCTGIQEWQNEESVIISPNPSSDFFIITYSIQEKAQLEITDITGKLMSRYNLPADENILQIKNDKLENGVYLYRILMGGNLLKTGKIVIVK